MKEIPRSCGMDTVDGPALRHYPNHPMDQDSFWEVATHDGLSLTIREDTQWFKSRILDYLFGFDDRETRKQLERLLEKSKKWQPWAKAIVEGTDPRRLAEEF